MNESNLEIQPIYQKWIQKIRSFGPGFWIFWVFLLWAIGRAVSQRWVCDDAFISFRYAKNLIRGLGLVFNEGELVEGYTNFLWTLGIAFGMKLGIDPLRWVQFWGIISYIGSILAVLFIGFRFYLENQTDQSFDSKKDWQIFLYDKNYIPFAALALSVQAHAQIYATGGLETSFFGFLIIAGSGLLLFGNKLKSIFLGQLFLSFAAMTRPEGILFLGTGMLYTFWFLKKRFLDFEANVRIFVSVIPFLLIFLPYWGWRWVYYEKFFPNTYYAKYGAGNYFDQGFTYIFSYLNAYYVFYFTILLTIFYIIRRYRNYPIVQYILSIFSIYEKKQLNPRKFNYRKYKEIFNAQNSSQNSNQPRDLIAEISFLLILPVLVYISYLVYIGGDFMFARLFISLSPVLFLWTECIWFLFFKKLLKKVFFVVYIVCLFLYYNPYKGTEIPVIDGISSENDIYKIKDIYQIKNSLIPYSSLIRSWDVRIAFGGAQAMYAYYLDPNIAIETSSGLTDEYIAQLPVTNRGKIGHEKRTPIKYLRKRRVHIHLDPAFHKKTDYDKIQFKSLPYQFSIVTYEKRVFDKLFQSERFQFQKFENYLENYIKHSSKIPMARKKKDYKKFKSYYFQWNPGSREENLFLEAM